MYTNGATCLSVENCLLTHINKIIETFGQYLLLPLLTVYVTGGVLVTVTANLLTKEIRKLQADAVSIWIQINMTKSSSTSKHYSCECLVRYF
jgi:fructose-specific phosphotransferase system IIC component